MIVHEIPYEWLERHFGTYVADNFNTAMIILGAIGLLIAIMLGRKIRFRINFDQDVSTTGKDYSEEFQELETEEPVTYQSQHGEWSPTGWVYDRDTQKWDPPEYLAEESARKWRWNEEKRIWVDQDKEERLQRYREYRRSQGNGPTYEEWKAAKLAEEKEKHSGI